MSRIMENSELYLGNTYQERRIDEFGGESVYADEPWKGAFVDVVPKTFLSNSHVSISQ